MVFFLALDSDRCFLPGSLALLCADVSCCSFLAFLWCGGGSTFLRKLLALFSSSFLLLLLSLPLLLSLSLLSSSSADPLLLTTAFSSLAFCAIMLDLSISEIRLGLSGSLLCLSLDLMIMWLSWDEETSFHPTLTSPFVYSVSVLSPPHQFSPRLR